MTAIPLPTGIQGVDELPRRQELLVNLFNPGDNTLLKTPGVSAFSVGDGACRGSITFEEEAYQVSGQSLIKISETGVKTTIGVIEGTANVSMAISFIALEIVVKGGKGYSYSTSGTLTEITDPNYKPSVDVESINQRFVFVPEDGGPLFFTDVNTPTTISTLNFFDAELLPDKNKGVINLKNDLDVGGVDSFEVFRDVGDTDAPFLRADGAAVETGYLTAKTRYRDTFLFLGRDREGSYAFHGMSSGSAPKISTPPIDEILNNQYTEDELSQCTSQRMTIKGTDMACFRLARHSFLYYGSGWSYMQSGVDGLGVINNWNVNHMSFAYGKYITGNATDANIGFLDSGVKEFGEDIERVIETFIIAESNSYFNIDNIYLSCTTGSSLVEGSVSAQVSKDGKKYGPQVPRPLAPIGHTEQQVSWLGGAGVFERFGSIRLRTTSDVDFSVDGLSVNV